MKWFVLSFILFFILTPGILLRLPPKGNKYTVAVVHGIVLVLLLFLAGKYFSKNLEGIKNNKNIEYQPPKREEQRPRELPIRESPGKIIR